MRATLGSFLKSVFAFGALAFQKMLVIITIFFATIIAVGLVSILGFSFYLKRKTKLIGSENQKQFAEPPLYRSLFEPNDAERRALKIEQQSEKRKNFQQEIFAKADANDFYALLEAQSFEVNFYNEVLSKLIQNAENAEKDEKLFSLCAFLDENNLRTNIEIVARLKTVWQKSFDKKDTIQLLHFSAKTESAEIFSETLETVIQHWQKDFIKNISFEELKRLVESEFWLLPANARTSGAGFLLKQKLANLRREVSEK